MISIDRQACDGCGLCVESCPTGALQLMGELIQVDNSLCEECYACVDVCPHEALVPSEIVEEEYHIPVASSSFGELDEIGISDTGNKPLARPVITVLGSPRRRLGDWLGAALNFLVFDLGPAVEGILKTESQRKGGDKAFFHHTEKSQREKRGRRGSGRKARRRRQGRR
ncbi:MAG TPA: 4Fe-4S binding protein [Anaerolineae bacterium]|nr:4Fe-4S binding protein [Anaerolineae bacterium]